MSASMSRITQMSPRMNVAVAPIMKESNDHPGKLALQMSVSAVNSANVWKMRRGGRHPLRASAWASCVTAVSVTGADGNPGGWFVDAESMAVRLVGELGNPAPSRCLLE